MLRYGENGRRMRIVDDRARSTSNVRDQHFGNVVIGTFDMISQKQRFLTGLLAKLPDWPE